MTIGELKHAIGEYREKNMFDFEKRIDGITDKLFQANPEDFEILKNESDEYIIVPASNDFSLLFRGQAVEITPCLPTLHRKSPTPLQIFIERLRFVEFERLLDTHPLVKHYRSKGFKLSTEGLAQHYGLKTEVMDFTSDIDIALFFAMCPYDFETDDYVIPDESVTHKGIIYVLNPYMYDRSLMANNKVKLFSKTVQPIGLQPFDRPGAQRGYGIYLPSGKQLEGIRVFDFEYSIEDAQEYHRRYTEQSVLWAKDELIRPVKSLSVRKAFRPSIFSEAWRRFPIDSLTKSQCLKLIEREHGITISQKAEMSCFEAEEIVENKMVERWNSYTNRVVTRKIMTVNKDNQLEDVSPVMTTEMIANMQMLRMIQSGMSYPEGTRIQNG